MRFGSKVPGSQMEVRDVTMDFGYGTSFTEASPEAYERLILDVLLGEPSLFPRERGGRAVVGDPRPGDRALGGAAPRAPTRTRRAPGGRSRRTQMMARTGRHVAAAVSRHVPAEHHPPRRDAAVIVDLPSSTVSASTRRSSTCGESGGVLALGRVLTLVIVTDDGSAIEGADRGGQLREPRAPVPGDRARPRPAAGRRRGSTRRSGSAATPGPARSIVLRGYGPLAADEAGAGMVMPLLLPDAPVVAWWPGEAPAVPSTDADRHAGRSGGSPTRCRRRTRCGRSSSAAPSHVAGDTDLAWTRLTPWRALLATALDAPPHDTGHRARWSRARRSRRRPT